MPDIRITTSDAKREAEGLELAETLISSNGLGYPDSAKIAAKISKSVMTISQSPMKSPLTNYLVCICSPDAIYLGAEIRCELTGVFMGALAYPTATNRA